MKTKSKINRSFVVAVFAFVAISFSSKTSAAIINDSANVPIINLPDISQENFQSSFDVLESNIMIDPLSGFTRPYQSPGVDYGVGWWQLDQSLELGADKWVNRQFSEDVIRNFIDEQAQNSDGHIDFYFGSSSIGVDSDYSSMPAYFNAAYDLIKRSDDQDFNHAAYLSMKKYYDWFKNAKTDEQTGLTKTFWEEGVYTIGNGIQNNEQIGVDLNVLLEHAAVQISEIANRLGYTVEEEYYLSEAERRKNAINTYLWDSSDNKYKNLNVSDHAFIEYDDIGTFYPLIDKIADSEKSNYLIERIVDDSLYGWNHWPLNTLSAQSNQFESTNGAYTGAAWKGNIWTLTNYNIIKGLEDSGRSDLAAKLIYDTIKLVNGSYNEYYTQDGSPQGSSNYGWTAAQYSQLIIEDMFGISFDAMTNTIKVSPHIPVQYENEDISIENVIIPTTGDKISVSISPLQNYERTITVDKNSSVNQYNLILDVPADYGNTGVVKLINSATGNEVVVGSDVVSFAKEDRDGDGKDEAYRVNTLLDSSPVSLKAVATDPGFFSDTFKEVPKTSSMTNIELSQGEASLSVSRSESVNISSSSEHESGVYSMNNLIDGSNGLVEEARGYWNDNTKDVFPDWIQLDLEIPLVVNRVNLRMPQSYNDFIINNVELQYFDGNDWVNITTLSLYTDQAGARNHNIPVDNITTSRLRVVFNEGNADGWSFLDEVEIFGTDVSQQFSGVLKSAIISPSDSFEGWENLSWHDTEGQNSSVNYQIEYYNGSSWELVSESDLPGNNAGLTSSPVDISGMEISKYENIRLVANFLSMDGIEIPSLQDWEISWVVGNVNADPDGEESVENNLVFGNPKLRFDGKRKSFSATLKNSRVTLENNNPEISNGSILIKNSKNRTIGTTGVGADGSWKIEINSKSFRIYYFNNAGTQVGVSKKYELNIDNEKPKLKSFPKTITVKKRGTVFSWNPATDNKKVSHYTIKFANRKYKTNKSQILIPFAVKSGLQRVVITAFDKVGNKTSKSVNVIIK